MLRLCFLCFPFWLSAQFALQANLLQLVNDPQLKGTKWSVCAIDLTTGDTLAAYDAAQQLPAASVVKLVSTAAALNILGPEHRAQTQLILKGQMKDHGVWDGSLHLIGGGDVSLGSRYFNETGKELEFIDEWVAQLQSKGITCINGAIIADGNTFGTFSCPLGWQPLDMGNYYGCGAFGLNFYDNTLKLNFQTGANGAPITLKSIFPTENDYQLTIQATSASVSSDQTFVHGVPFNYQRTIKGKLPANRSAFEVKASMPDPEKLLAELVYQRLQASGIRVDGGFQTVRTNPALYNKAYPASEIIHIQQGKTLQELVYWTNQRSVNLFAEGNLLQIGARRYGAGTYENSLVVLDSLLLAWGVGPCRIVDGGGLSKENRMSASQFVQVLKTQTNTTYFESYYKSIPVAGQTGTVKNLCKGQPGEGKVHAKSGSIEGIKAYAGYVESKSGHQIAFTIIANDYPTSGSAMAKKMEPFLNSLATYQVQP